MATETILKEVPMFSQLPAESLEELVKTGQTLLFEADQVVCWEGEESDAMYVVLDGRIRVYKHDEKGNEVDIDALKAGDFFGEMALVDNEPRSATVVCVTACHLFMLDKDAFMNLLQNASAQVISFSVLSALVSRVRAVSKKFFDEELSSRMMQAEMETERHRSLAQMVAGVAHEVNTPLGIVNTAVDMIDKRIKNDKLTAPLSENKASQAALAEMQEATELALRNTDRAHKLVQNFKKISVSQLSATREIVNLSDLVLDILELFKINARRANFQIEVKDSLPANQKAWSGYPGHLTQVLTNLLFNIQKHAYPHQIGGKIEIGLCADDKRKPAQFVLTVQDYGRGIDPKNLPQVFAPFFTTDRSKGGAGLGLTIAHNIVTEALKGTIVVESELNKGTIFTATFPQII